MMMLSWQDLVDRSPALKNPVNLTIGVFDGLHIGHRRLIGGITGGNTTPLVISFRESPSMLRNPALFPGFILSWKQRLERFESLGLGAVLAIDFSEEFSNLSGKAFIGFLSENLTIQRIVVGQNFRFGKNRDSGTDDLKEMFADTEIDVQVMEPVVWDNAIVSSSRIRAAIRNADFANTRAMLASDYSLDLRGLAGQSKAAGSARIARRDVRQVLPPEGHYGVACVGSAGTRPGRLTVGTDILTLDAADCGDIMTVDFTEARERSTANAAHKGS